MELIRKFISGKLFERQWASLGLSDDDLKELQSILLDDPKKGNVIQGTGRLRKMRFSYGNRGTSHCARVCYVDFEKEDTIFFVMIFAKKEMENLTASDKNALKKKIDMIEKKL